VDSNTVAELRAKPLPVGATVFAKIGEAIRSNKRAITSRPCLVDNNAAGIKAITGLAEDRFVYYLWCQIPLIEHAGGVVPAVNKSAIEEIHVCYPQPAEQKKIADCLTWLDEVIRAQGRKVEALKAHKRGLMQQLFPREGETRPRLRFPEFRDAAEWITRPLGELMAIGSSRRVHESDWATTGVPFYRAREIVALRNGEPINPLFISESLYAEFVGLTGEIEVGQLLVTGVGSIGVPYLVKDGDRFYFKDGNIIWMKNDQADLLGQFLIWLFESEFVQGQIITMAGVGTVGTYTIENAKRTLAIFPEDKREQQRIADCLSSFDTRIAAESRQLGVLKAHKQGLVQQLFPALKGN
jgi:type I restriction enzyme S subunit